jgi:hypothetical protein
MGATALVGCAWLAGCGGFGKVQQGRAVAYYPEQGRLTLILDSNPRDLRNPRYDVLPAATVHVPADRSQMGPAPRAGKLLSVDVRGRQATVFEEPTQSIRVIPITPLEVRDQVARDDARVTSARLPRVDRAAGTITVYSPHHRQIVTFALAEQHLTLPESTWAWGDEVRYYYKEPGQALRLMNVTRTDLTKGK